MQHRLSSVIERVYEWKQRKKKKKELTSMIMFTCGWPVEADVSEWMKITFCITICTQTDIDEFNKKKQRTQLGSNGVCFFHLFYTWVLIMMEKEMERKRERERESGIYTSRTKMAFFIRFFLSHKWLITWCASLYTHHELLVVFFICVYFLCMYVSTGHLLPPMSLSLL